MSKETGGPAFPSIQWDEPKPEQSANWQYEGMTLWDFYAAHALTGIFSISAHPSVDPVSPFEWDKVAKTCADAADALIAERKKRFEDSNG